MCTDSLMTRVHTAGTDRGRGGGGSVSEKSCQSLFTDQVKELDSCSTPQKKVLIIPLDSSAVMKGWCCPAELLGLSWMGGSAKQQMAAAATTRAVRPPPPRLTMVEPDGGGGGTAATTLAGIFIYSKRGPQPPPPAAASRLRRKQVPPR